VKVIFFQQYKIEEIYKNPLAAFIVFAKLPLPYVKAFPSKLLEIQ
jgi:hypothetical protein